MTVYKAGSHAKLNLELFLRHKAGDKKALDELLLGNRPLVVQIATAVCRKYLNDMRVALDDLIQDGMLGLCRAIEKFDPERGYAFSTYASRWIWNKVDIAARNAKSPVWAGGSLKNHRDLLKTAMNSGSLDQIVLCGEEGGVLVKKDQFVAEDFNLLEKIEATEILRVCEVYRAVLNPWEQDIFDNRVLGGFLGIEETRAEVAARWGKTGQAVSLMEKKLREELQSVLMNEFQD